MGGPGGQLSLGMARTTLVLVALALGLTERGGAQAVIREDTVRVLHQSALANPRIRESSGLAASRRERGLFWTLNDSGNPPEIFATDSSGADRGSYRVRGADNVDWEAMALAPCGTRYCLYLADTGDNALRRQSVLVYRVSEPDTRNVSSGTLGVDAELELEFEDGPRNVEAILVTADQDLYLVSKERSGGGRVYFVDRRGWDRRGRVTARFLHDLPFPDGLGYQVTDAALAANGSEVAIRTYRYIYFFRLHEGRLEPDRERPRCDAGGLDVQGEGIAWTSRGLLATTSERVLTLGGTISLVECRSE